jgi:hypothetical protein
MCFDSIRNRTVLFGGLSAGARLGDTWEWDGSFWTQMNDIGPAVRDLSAMVYDSSRKVSVLFGGQGAQNLGDTWQWDGTDWTQVSDTGPIARSNHAMAFDSVRNRTVLFAGQSAENQHLGDTWEFDGEAWTQQQDAGPPSRGCHCMAFDSVSNRVIMFGGEDVNNHSLADTWAWDGREWVQIAEIGPPPRLSATMASDGGSSIILFGGVSTRVPVELLQIFGDTWEFDGKRWTQRQDIGPSGQGNAAMAFDSARGRVVLFGQGSVSGLTWEAPVVVVPTTLRVLSISVPADVRFSVPTTITFTLDGPAAAGGTLVHLSNLLADMNGNDILNFTIPAGLTTSSLTAKFKVLGPVTFAAGVNSLSEAAVTVVVAQLP